VKAYSECLTILILVLWRYYPMFTTQFQWSWDKCKLVNDFFLVFCETLCYVPVFPYLILDFFLLKSKNPPPTYPHPFAIFAFTRIFHLLFNLSISPSLLFFLPFYSNSRGSEEIRELVRCLLFRSLLWLLFFSLPFFLDVELKSGRKIAFLHSLTFSQIEVLGTPALLMYMLHGSLTCK
jgi:hypothetical protein